MHPSVQAAAERETSIKHLNANDVLFGRGGATNSYIGNKNFRALVKEYQDKYIRAKKKDKATLISELVAKIRSRGGRFLERHEVKENGLWRDVGDGKAKDKTGQALREGAPRIRKRMRNSKETVDESKPRKKVKFSNNEKKDSKVESINLERDEKSQAAQLIQHSSKGEKPVSGIYEKEDICSNKVKSTKREGSIQLYAISLKRVKTF